MFWPPEITRYTIHTHLQVADKIREDCLRLLVEGSCHLPPTPRGHARLIPMDVLSQTTKYQQHQLHLCGLGGSGRGESKDSALSGGIMASCNWYHIIIIIILNFIHCTHAPLASIPGRTEDGPGIDCLRMRHIIPRNWGLWITSYLCSVKQWHHNERKWIEERS